MAKLIYSMITSLDGYTEDERGRFGWGAPDGWCARRQLELVEGRRFRKGVVFLRYAVRE